MRSASGSAFCSKFGRLARAASRACCWRSRSRPRPRCRAESPPPVTFDWFEYTGRDAVFETPAAAAGSFRNPILAGFYPDPSVTRAGDRFYLVNSTFAYFPGIPVFESADLVHWRHVGNVIDRPSQLDFDGLGVSRGVFAPDIEFHDGTFYVLNTAVDSGGNFFVTAKSAAGPWSDPVWLRRSTASIPRCSSTTTARPTCSTTGRRKARRSTTGIARSGFRKFDVPARQARRPAQGARQRRRRSFEEADLDRRPAPLQARRLVLPHVRGRRHGPAAFRSGASRPLAVGPVRRHTREIPILTQRDLAADRANPITNAGHADLVEAPDGSWWAIFLATRTYASSHYNTGRETFLLPVTWQDGWPVILQSGRSDPVRRPGPEVHEHRRQPGALCRQLHLARRIRRAHAEVASGFTCACRRSRWADLAQPARRAHDSSASRSRWRR